MTTAHPPSALELACSIRDKTRSCAELTEESLARIAAQNPKTNAFVEVFARRARRHARRLERQLQGSDPTQLPTFFGVPIGIKDLDPVRFSFNRAGSRAFRYLWTPFDSPLVKRIRGAGFVLLGKLATSEFAILPITETEVHPPCRNPWNLGHTPGGSSGGSAAAVASGMLPIAHASDGAGSIRIPAAFCHLYGLKTSRGTLPNYYETVDPIGLSSIHAVTHTVEDSAAMLDALTLQLYDPRNPPASSILGQSLQDPPPLRIRFCVDSPLSHVEPQIVEALKQIAKTLESLGHHVEEGEMLDASVDDFLPIMLRQTANVPSPRESILQPATRWLRAQGRKLSKQDAVDCAQAFARKVLSWFGDIDIMLTPTAALFPPPVGSLDGLSGQDAFESIVPLGAFTAPFNVSGQPAASIPAGFSPDRLPFGIQLVAQPGKDALLLALSRQLQEASPWRKPPPQ